jgi:hypothetical protein
MTKTSKSAANVKTEPDHIIEFAIFDTPGFGQVPIIIRPEDDAWSDTLRKLTELQVDKWRSSYCNPEIMDGRGWFLTVRSTELKIKSSGSNDYPPNFDEIRKVMEATQMCASMTRRTSRGISTAHRRAPTRNGFSRCRAPQKRGRVLSSSV